MSMVPKSDTSTTVKPRRSGRVPVPVQIAPVNEAPIKKVVKSAVSRRKASRPSLKRSESLSSLSTDSSLSPPPEARSKLDQRSLRFLQILFRPLAMPDGTRFFPKEVGSVSHIAARLKKARGHVDRSLHATQSKALPGNSRLSISSPSSLSSLDSTASPSTLQSPPHHNADSQVDIPTSSAHASNNQAAHTRDAHTKTSNNPTRPKHIFALDDPIHHTGYFKNFRTGKLAVPLNRLIGPGTPRDSCSKQACRALYDLHPDWFSSDVLHHLGLPKNHASQPQETSMLAWHERDETYDRVFTTYSTPFWFTHHKGPLPNIEGMMPQAEDQNIRKWQALEESALWDPHQISASNWTSDAGSSVQNQVISRSSSHTAPEMIASNSSHKATDMPMQHNAHSSTDAIPSGAKCAHGPGAIVGSSGSAKDSKDTIHTKRPSECDASQPPVKTKQKTMPTIETGTQALPKEIRPGKQLPNEGQTIQMALDSTSSAQKTERISNVKHQIKISPRKDNRLDTSGAQVPSVVVGSNHPAAAKDTTHPLPSAVASTTEAPRQTGLRVIMKRPTSLSEKTKSDSSGGAVDPILLKS